MSSAAPLELVTFSVPFAGCLSENASSPASFWSAYLEVLLGSEGPSINTVWQYSTVALLYVALRCVPLRCVPMEKVAKPFASFEGLSWTHLERALVRG